MKKLGWLSNHIVNVVLAFNLKIRDSNVFKYVNFDSCLTKTLNVNIKIKRESHASSEMSLHVNI